MKKLLGQAWLRVFGWRVEGARPSEKRYVLIAAPHTSNWDLPFTLAVAFALDVKLTWMGKHTLFKFPFGWFMRMLGGMPIERHKRGNVVAQSIEILRQADEMALTVPAEGTRGKREFWKSGFYHIAHGAEVPLLLGYLDFARKRGGVGASLMLTGDVVKDMDRIRDFYEGRLGKNPELYTPPLLREELEGQAVEAA